MAGITLSLLKRFSNAEKRLLQNTEGKKLYDCTDGEIKQMLAYCCLMVGIDRPPADDKKVVMVSFLRKYHGSLTNKQVAQAFELAAAGELGNETREHYNSISPMYISIVIRAYLHKLNGIKNRLEVKKRLESSSKSSPADYYGRLVKVIEQYHVIPLFWAWEEVFEYLNEVNNELRNDVRTDENKILSAEEKKEAVINYFRKKYPDVRLQTAPFIHKV